MSSEEAISYIESILVPDDIIPIKTLLSRLDRAPRNARRYFNRHCQNKTELEKFLREYTELFFVENRKVALFENDFEESCKMAEQFFELKIQESKEALHYMEIKKQCLDDASDQIASFICRFYPGNTIKSYFENRPDIFVVLQEKVYLIEEECVKFYKNMIQTFGTRHYIGVRGYIGQADKHVTSYVNRNYFADRFQLFIEKHSNVFRMDKSGNVFLVCELKTTK